MKNSILINTSKGNGIKGFIKEYGPAYLMVAPSVIMFVLFTIYPLGWVLSNTFFDTDGASYRIFVGFDNFVKMFKDKLWWDSVLTTIRMAFRQLIIQIPVSVVLATILNSKLRGKGFFRMAYYMPAVTSSAVMSLVFSFIFSPYNGIVNVLLNKIGIPGIDWLGNENTAMWSIVLLCVWASFGGNVLLFLSGLQGISNEIYESADLDGAGNVRKFFSITLPLLAPVLKTVLMLALIGSLQVMEPVMIMTNGGPNHGTETMSLYIYNRFFSASSLPQYGYGATLGLGGSVVIGIITMIYNMVAKKLDNIV